MENSRSLKAGIPRRRFVVTKKNRECSSTLRSLDIRGKAAGTRKQRVSLRYKEGPIA